MQGVALALGWAVCEGKDGVHSNPYSHLLVAWVAIRICCTDTALARGRAGGATFAAGSISSRATGGSTISFRSSAAAC
jgi:hypothetical protein